MRYKSKRATPRYNTWIVYIDGSSCELDSAIGIILNGPNSKMSNHTLCFQLNASNNQAEYKALMVGLKLAHHVKMIKVVILNNLRLTSSPCKGN